MSPAGTDTRSADAARPRRWGWLAVLALAALSAAASSVAMRPRNLAFLGPVELETKSDYSHIRIRRSNNLRTMSFVRDSGEEVVESRVDLQKPHELAVPYTRFMFLSYVFRPQQQRALIVGLGGGGMVHFLQKYDPRLNVDVVEIDPVIVKLADQYFGVRNTDHVRIITADAFKYLAETEHRYDVIYMDAFLKPSAETDSTGAPLNLRTEKFYRDVQQKLVPGGLMVFNLNSHQDLREDVATIKAAFPQAYVYELPESNGVVAVGTLAPERLSTGSQLQSASEVGRRLGVSFSFPDMVRRVQR